MKNINFRNWFYIHQLKRHFRKLTLKDWMQILIIPFTGLVVTLVIHCSQKKSAEFISENQRKLYALEIFRDKLTGDRISRNITLDCIRILEEDKFYDSLIKISDLATIEKLKDSIWSESAKSRMDAIIEYAKLFGKDTTYQPLVLDALKPRFQSHLDTWAPAISIAQFFTLLERYTGDSLWTGTKQDSIDFTMLKQSKYYLHPDSGETPNVQPYLVRGLNNYRPKYYKK